MGSAGGWWVKRTGWSKSLYASHYNLAVWANPIKVKLWPIKYYRKRDTGSGQTSWVREAASELTDLGYPDSSLLVGLCLSQEQRYALVFHGRVRSLFSSRVFRITCTMPQHSWHVPVAGRCVEWDSPNFLWYVKVFIFWFIFSVTSPWSFRSVSEPFSGCRYILGFAPD